MNMGKKAEKLARTYLEEQGLSFVTSNFRRRFGEIDLIMRDGKFLTFIEVKYRSSTSHGSAVEQVTSRKQRKIKLTAEAYLQIYSEAVPFVRFDVIGISPQGLGYSYQWVKGAFE